ncbi:MAG: hypothetical protein C4311_06510 [Chloroflexota bacterium]
MVAENALQQAIAALKAGRRKQARAILAHLLRQDPHNEEAWLWLSGAVEQDSERLLCLRQVLAINPNNERARRGVELLLSKGVTLPPLAPATPPSAPPEHEPYPAEPAGEVQPQAQVEPAGAVPPEAGAKEAPPPPVAAGEMEGVAEIEPPPLEAALPVVPEAVSQAEEVLIEEAQPPEAGEEAAPEAPAVAEAAPFVPPPIPEGFVLPDEGGAEAEAEPGLSLRGLVVLILLLIILIAAITILLSQRGV